MRKILIIFITFLLCSTFTIFVNAAENENSNYDIINLSFYADIYVDNEFNESTIGWNVTHFNTIQKGIDNATSGDTVYVFNGTYYENIIVDKLVNLTGEDKETTIIDGGGIDDVVYITADNVIINGFTIQNSGINNSYYPNDAGIDIRSKNNIIFNNIISSNKNSGICLDSIYKSESDLYTKNNTIFNNIIENNNMDGILIFSSRYNEISNNIIRNNGQNGILLFLSNHNISDNIIINNIIGINIKYSGNNFINNTISENNIGIHFQENSHNNYIIYNTIRKNEFGIFTTKPDDLIYKRLTNFIYFNNFIDNDRNIYYWKNLEWFGNYWDQWIGLKIKCLSFLPYHIRGSILSNYDWHPAKEPNIPNNYNNFQIN